MVATNATVFYGDCAWLHRTPLRTQACTFSPFFAALSFSKLMPPPADVALPSHLWRGIPCLPRAACRGRAPVAPSRPRLSRVSEINACILCFSVWLPKAKKTRRDTYTSQMTKGGDVSLVRLAVSVEWSCAWLPIQKRLHCRVLLIQLVDSCVRSLLSPCGPAAPKLSSRRHAERTAASSTTTSWDCTSTLTSSM